MPSPSFKCITIGTFAERWPHAACRSSSQAVRFDSLAGRQIGQLKLRRIPRTIANTSLPDTNPLQSNRHPPNPTQTNLQRRRPQILRGQHLLLRNQRRLHPRRRRCQLGSFLWHRRRRTSSGAGTAQEEEGGNPDDGRWACGVYQRKGRGGGRAEGPGGAVST